jgi:hypothetical protein
MWIDGTVWSEQHLHLESIVLWRQTAKTIKPVSAQPATWPVFRPQVLCF